MADRIRLRRQPRSCWQDFLHRIVVGLVVFGLILLAGLILR